MVRKETCSVCRGNKVVAAESRSGIKSWRPCHGCNGAGYLVRVTPRSGQPARY